MGASDYGFLSTWNGNGETKHHVYVKREQQKYLLIMSFPPLFTLPFAVFNVKKPVLAFAYNANISLKFLIRSATVISLCLSPMVFCLFFYTNWPVSCQCLNKRKKKVRENEVMFNCQLRKGYQLFCGKSTKIMQYVKSSQGTHIQPVTNI